jgi:hypothetical protein
MAAEASVINAASATITKTELKRYVDVLADDSFEGRSMGSRGGRAAGGYIVNELEKLGLKGIGDDGTFFQSYSGGARNILAMLEGSDPELKKQYVIIGAHYDHVGYGNSSNSYGPFGYIHNGADDNASGVSGLLEIAQAYTSLPEPPKRSVVFALWDGEEAGLLGSKYWMSRPTLATKNIALYINLDMIGRLRKQRVEVYGTRSSYGLRELISRNNTGELWLDFTWEMKENSDHWTFYERNFPTLMFHTGLHDNYHRPSDDAHLLNTEGIEQVARLVFAASNAIADSDQTWKFRSESRREDPAAKRAFEQVLAAPGPRLGMEWKDAKNDEAGVVVTRVTPGLPAAKAGIQAGDRILKFGGHDVTAQTPLRMEVLAARTPVEVELLRGGKPEPMKVSVQLLGSPSRIGITWRDDSAEPGTVLLTQVQYGSAAHRAGLKERDRVYEIGGQRFANSSEFRKLATTLPSPFDVLIERGGRTYKLTLEPPQVAAN